MIQRLLEQQVLWVVIIFTLVMAAILFIVMKFRARPGAPEPKHIHGHTGLEIAWTIAPAVILTLIAIPTVATIYHTQAPAPPNSLVVRAIGHQWWWEFQYPDLGVTTATDMVVPVGRTVSVHIETVDVLHSFWFPAMGGKRDAVPGRVNKIFFTPDRPGEFPGQCAELCGVSHANMRMRLYVRTPEEFDAWVAAQKSGPLEPEPGSLAATGKQTFQTGACIACHTVTGVAAGVIGPNLTHVASRSSIAGGIYPNDAEHLGHWITDPPSRKPGSLMPKMPMTPDQVQALVAYITSLK
jgi:cytochrome c oxidase subunit 2